MDKPNQFSRHLSAARAGDAAAFGEVLEGCRRYLTWVSRRELDPDFNPKAGASDLVQETFLEAHRDFGAFNGSTEEELLSWLRRLLLNNIANCSRRYRGTLKRSMKREVSIDATGSGEQNLTRSVARNADPAANLVVLEQRELLHDAIAQLTPDHRQVIDLWYEELTFEEIGSRMKRSSNAARMLWMRAVESLQGLLERNALADRDD